MTTTNSNHDGFKRGGRGVFLCAECGRMTRETSDTLGSRHCPLCVAKGEAANSLSDGGYQGNAHAAFDGCTNVTQVHRRQAEIETTM